jgi:hypothetical protein
MYSTRAHPDRPVVSTSVVGVTADGDEVRLSGGEVGLRRAEFEGQLDRLTEQPELLGLLAESYATGHPDAEPLVAVRVVQRRHALDDGRRTGEVTESVLVDHNRSRCRPGGHPVSAPAVTPSSATAPGRTGWWFRPVPLARIAVFRTIAYLFVPVDVFLTTAWVRAHADVPTEWYAPLTIGQLLPLPHPTHTLVVVVQWALVAAALAAATGRAPRLLGTAVFLLYLEWMVIAMSYGKVDHDRIAYLVALAVLPTIGLARWRDKRSSEAAGGPWRRSSSPSCSPTSWPPGRRCASAAGTGPPARR